jgi:hypothetical protein
VYKAAAGVPRLTRQSYATRGSDWRRELPTSRHTSPQLPQMLVQVEVEVPLAAQTRKQASRGVSTSPQSEQVSLERPQIEAQVEVEVCCAMHSS